MRIGLAYDLRQDYLKLGLTEEETAEFDSEETIASLHEALSSLGHEVRRIGNIYELSRRLCSGERWDLVFNICEGLYGRSREAQVPALLEAFDIPYTFSDPLTCAVCLDKSAAKTIVRGAGIPTPDFLVVSDLKELDSSNVLRYPLFAKPLSEGTGKGVTSSSVVFNGAELKAQCAQIIERYGQPALVEDYLPGREFTVGVLGTGQGARVVGALEVKLKRNAEPLVYSFSNKEHCETRVAYSLVKESAIMEEAAEVALAAYNVLECRDAGRVDLRADRKGRLNFVEMNPLAGLHPTHSDLPILCRKAKIPYNRLLSEIVSSAMGRGGAAKHPALRTNLLKMQPPLPSGSREDRGSL